MSDKLPALSGVEVIEALEQVGFHVDRISSSHHVMKKDGHPFVVTVPVHSRKDIKRGTLRRIIRDAGLTRNEFISLVK